MTSTASTAENWYIRDRCCAFAGTRLGVFGVKDEGVAVVLLCRFGVVRDRDLTRRWRRSSRVGSDAFGGELGLLPLIL